MRFHIKKDLLNNRKRLIIVVSIIMVLIIASMFISVTVDPFSSSEVNAVIFVDKEILRVGEVVTFDSSNSTGEIDTFAWEFGDGNTSNNISIQYQYEIAGWYNVTLRVSNKDGGLNSERILLGIQCADVHFEESFGRTIDVNPGSWQGRGPAAGISRPNLGFPTITGDWIINDAIGTYTFEVLIFTEERSYPYLNEERTAFREDLLFSLEISPDELPEDIVRVDAIVWVEQGGWSGGSFTFDVVYPLDDLSPP